MPQIVPTPMRSTVSASLVPKEHKVLQMLSVNTERTILVPLNASNVAKAFQLQKTSNVTTTVSTIIPSSTFARTNGAEILSSHH
jgi:hypothetical protein